MGQAFPESLARGAARQLYRLLRISAPLLRPFYRHVGLESRARAVTALVRIGWNGAELTPPPLKQSEIVAPERLAPGVACIGHPAAEFGVGEAFAARRARLQPPTCPSRCSVSINTPRRGFRTAAWRSMKASASARA